MVSIAALDSVNDQNIEVVAEGRWVAVSGTGQFKKEITHSEGPNNIYQITVSHTDLPDNAATCAVILAPGRIRRHRFLENLRIYSAKAEVFNKELRIEFRIDVRSGAGGTAELREVSYICMIPN